jgi:hypothetical protein
MYAAAGGTACRQARKRQAQQASKEKAVAQQKALKEKLATSKANLATPTKSKQFHQLPANYYLKTPYGGMRKLSAGYTGHSSKLLLPINEQNTSQQFLNQTARTPTFGHRELRLDVEHHKTLTKSATASFPLASQAATPPASPMCPFHHPQAFTYVKESQSNLLSLQVPTVNDGIIITPATPLPSPSPSDMHNNQNQHIASSTHDLRISSPLDEMPEFPLERACSVYRNRKLESDDTTKLDVDEERADHMDQQFYVGTMPNGHTTDGYCDAENRVCICTCDRVEVNFSTQPLSYVFPMCVLLLKNVIIFN